MSKEEKIKDAICTETVLNAIAICLKKGKPVELKVEKEKLVVVSIERHATIKAELGNQE